MSFVAGFYGQGSQLPGRAQNLPFFSQRARIELVPHRRGRDAVSGTRSRLGPYTPAAQHDTSAIGFVGLALLVLSPSAVAALWQLRQAPDFRQEARAQFDSLANDPQPIAYVAPIATTPSLLFANPLRSDANAWPNTCLAKFFAKRAVLPKPDTHDE
jgi:hypothetical protein